VLTIILLGWKIVKASKLAFNGTFPFLHIETKESYKSNSTAEHDDRAMKYMIYALFPLLTAYVVYSFLYEGQKSLYSFVVKSLAQVVYTFGFIMMCPQLYINYKLQSVEHMPGQALFYRFLNTIVDDLFSFIITMPNMHRISCFRDDVIFVVFLY
jgi:hypothetical protein